MLTLGANKLREVDIVGISSSTLLPTGTLEKSSAVKHYQSLLNIIKLLPEDWHHENFVLYYCILVRLGRVLKEVLRRMQEEI